MDFKKTDFVNRIMYMIDDLVELRAELNSDPDYKNCYDNMTNSIINLRHVLGDIRMPKSIESSEDRNKDNLDKIFNSKPIKSSTYQFVAEFDGKYQPRIIDYMFKNGTPSWTDANEDYSNGKVFTEQELPKVAKQLERYYAETGGGASDIEIVRDNGDSVYLEEFLQEGSFDKAWEKAVVEDEAWEKEHFWDKED